MQQNDLLQYLKKIQKSDKKIIPSNVLKMTIENMVEYSNKIKQGIFVFSLLVVGFIFSFSSSIAMITNNPRILGIGISLGIFISLVYVMVHFSIDGLMLDYYKELYNNKEKFEYVYFKNIRLFGIIDFIYFFPDNFKNKELYVDCIIFSTDILVNENNTDNSNNPITTDNSDNPMYKAECEFIEFEIIKINRIVGYYSTNIIINEV